MKLFGDLKCLWEGKSILVKITWSFGKRIKKSDYSVCKQEE